MSKAFLHSQVGESGLVSEMDSCQLREDGALTAYFRQLGDRMEPVSGVVFDRFWRALSSVMKRELHRRGLWNSPPRFVGLEASETWNDEVLEELVSECYIFLMQRLRPLHQHLKIKPNIDGLVLLNVKHFLYERQKRCDPLGFRIFDIARCAVRLAIEEGTLRLVAGDPRIQNSTVLEPHGRRAPAESRASEPPTSESPVERTSLLQDNCDAWVDALIPGLFLAHGRQRQAVAERLARALATLDLRDVGSLTFKVLVDALKAAARVRWKAVWIHEQGWEKPPEKGQPRGGSRDRLASPSSAVVFQPLAFEDEESFKALAREVSAAVESAPATVQQRQYLTQLWDFLRTSSADPGTAAIPSRRRVAELLGIPRYLLPELYRQLGKMIESCRQQARPAPVKRRQGRGGL